MNAEEWFKKKLGVPESWDRSDYEMPRYSFNDMVDFAEQFSNQEVKKALRTCNCKMPEKRIKVNEKGTSAYCEKCSHEIKNHLF